MGINTLPPVDVYIPGCPPRPEMVIDVLMKLQNKVQGETLEDHIKGPALVTPASKLQRQTAAGEWQRINSAY